MGAFKIKYFRFNILYLQINAHFCFKVGGFDGAARLRSAEAYNPLNDSWHDIRSMINPRSNFGIEVTFNVYSAEIAVFEVSH